MRGGVGVEVQRAAARALHTEDRGDPHGEIGIGLTLVVEGSKAVHQPRDDEPPSAVHQPGTRWDGKIGCRPNADDGVTLLRGGMRFVCIELSSGRPRRLPQEFIDGYGPAVLA